MEKTWKNTDYHTERNQKILKTEFFLFQKKFTYSNFSEFKEKLKIGNNSAAEFDTKFINIAELFTKSDSTQSFLNDFVKSSTILINLVSIRLPNYYQF